MRLQPKQTIDDIAPALVEDCAQLVKANSIRGNKLNNIDVVYTMWNNLKKTGNMDVGQVGFKCDRDVRKIRIERRCNEIINRLNKTERRVTQVDFRLQREERDRIEREQQKDIIRQQRLADANEMERREREKRERGYENVMVPEKMQSNRDDGNDSDDFM